MVKQECEKLYAEYDLPSMIQESKKKKVESAEPLPQKEEEKKSAGIDAEIAKEVQEMKENRFFFVFDTHCSVR